MQSTCLPSIKSLLDSTSIGSVYGYTPSHPTPVDPITTNNNGSYHHISSQSNPDAHHLAAINAHNKQVMHPSSHNPHPSNIRSLLSPPESPDISSHQHSFLDSYGTQRYDERYNVSQQQCSCCTNKLSSAYSPSTPIMNTYNQQHSVSNYNPYIQPVQRYSSFSSTIQPIPISPYDHKSTTSSRGLPFPTAKHYSQKNLAGQLSPNSSSSGNRYQCSYCSKRFSRPSSLRIHIYSHTGEKPFVCTEPGCGRKFSVQSNMRRHLRVHRLGRPVKKNRYDGEVDGVKIMSPASILQSY
ncbi:hypothetical protein C1645_871565 [Glomus cerebriforme]|uniref:C2H2-type domain-containing protein n=1 Tax=Glomus cerebriforme TaxID=658196 RepID=A0A397TGG4_9GLOM|nr:hypothetical protein C1645_871565 [Glomus cerebriforme]